MIRTTARVSLEPIDAALTCAHDALDRRAQAPAPERRGMDVTVDQALVQLACAACDAVAAWESKEPTTSAGADNETLEDRVLRWRGQIDELRVQVALAELELRDTSHASLAMIEQSAGAVERLLSTTVRDIVGALSTFRSDLRRPHG